MVWAFIVVVVAVVLAVKLVAVGVVALLGSWENRGKAEMGVCPHGPDYTCRFCR